MNVEENSKKIQALSDEFHKHVEEVEDKIVKEVKANTESIIEDKVKDVWDLEKERAKRARNVIVTEVPEPTGSIEEKGRADFDSVCTLFKDKMMIRESDVIIQSVWRIGKYDADKTRCLKVVLDREFMVGTVLKASRVLQNSSDELLKKISIFKDLIQIDRDQRKLLVSDLKEKNRALKDTDPQTTDKYVIRNEKVILVDKDYNPKSF